MTSKISGNKASSEITFWSLMREDLRRRTWMIALSVLGSFLSSPVLFLLYNHNNNYRYQMIFTNTELTPAQVAEGISEMLAEYLRTYFLSVQMILLFFGAVIVAIFGFRHLYSRRMIDLYHSVPVTRNRAFLVYWLNGFLIWLVPFLAGSLSVYLMSLFRIGMPAYWGRVTIVFPQLIALCILCFFIIYNACLVAVMISGNLMNALINLLTYGLLVTAGYLTGLLLLGRFDTAYIYPSLIQNSIVSGLSPFVSAFWITCYYITKTPFAGWAGLFLMSIAFMAVNFALAMYLHGKRKSELAEHGLEARVFRIPARFAISMISGLLFALFFNMLADSVGWLLFGAVFGCALAFAVLNIIYHGGFKYVSAHRIQFAACLGCTLALLIVCSYDLIGYDTYLPDEKEITGLSLRCSALESNSYSYAMRQSDILDYSSGEFPPKDLTYTDSHEIHELLSALIRPAYAPGEDQKTSSSMSLVVRVDTRRGSYYRAYTLMNTAQHRALLRPFIENAAYREHFFPESREDWPLPEHLSVRSLNDAELLVDSTDRIAMLLKAYREDLLEHYSLETISNGHGGSGDVCTLALSTGSPRLLPLPIADSYQRTLALLQEWYPNQLWSYRNARIISLTLDCNTLTALYNHSVFGESEDSALENTSHKAEVLTIDPPAIDPPALTDPDLLALLTPYLIPENSIFNWNIFARSTQSYRTLGTVTMSFATGGKEQDVIHRSCYIDVNAFPEELLEKLLEYCGVSLSGQTD